MAWILKLIQEGEHQKQDFKLRIDDSRKIAKTVAAFANTDGGRLLIGVRDNGTVGKINVQEELHMIQAAAEMYCRPPIKFQPQVWHVDVQKVLEVSIDRSDERPHFAEIEPDKWRAYVRRDDEVFMANEVLLKVWEHENQGGQRWEFEYDAQKEALFQHLKVHSSVGFIKAARITGLDQTQTEDLLAQLVSWEILEMTPAEKGAKGYSYRMREGGA